MGALVRNWDEGQLFDLIFVFEPKRKRNSQDFRSPEVRFKTKIDELYKKVNP